MNVVGFMGTAAGERRLASASRHSCLHAIRHPSLLCNTQNQVAVDAQPTWLEALRIVGGACL